MSAALAEPERVLRLLEEAEPRAGSLFAVIQEHGGPVRLYVAPMYGYKSTKWLSGITVINQYPYSKGYWEDLGYDVDGWVGGSNGRDDRPTS